MKVWFVRGETGEYDDATHWVAAVCANKRTAVALCEKFTKIAKGVRVGGSHSDKRWEAFWTAREIALKQLAKAGDLEPQISYTGSVYEVVEVPLYATVGEARRKEK